MEFESTLGAEGVVGAHGRSRRTSRGDAGVFEVRIFRADRKREHSQGRASMMPGSAD